MTKSFVVLSLGVLLTGMVVSCSGNSSVQFPNTELIYQSSRSEAPSIGFINADGSSNTLLAVDFYATQPVASADGTVLYFRQIPGHLASVQPGWGAKFSFWREGYSVGDCSDKWWGATAIVPLKTPLQALVLLGSKKLLQVDVDKCQEEKLLIEYGDDQKQDMRAPSISSDDSQLLYTERTLTPASPYNYEIVSMDLASGQVTHLGIGINAVFSPDDSKIAYTNFDGIYMMDADGANRRLILEYDARGHNDFENAPPAPQWSPDGKWLIYHKCMKPQDLCSHPADYSIFKVDTITSEETMVKTGGVFPSWRIVSKSP